MARKSQDRRRVDARLEQIDERLFELEAELEVLKSERIDLENAARVLDKLSGLGSTAENAEPSGNRLDQEQDADISVPRLTIGELALIVLREAGAIGLTSSDVLEKIREKWMPDLMRTSLSPPLSRLKERGEITLEHDRWRIINDF